MRRLTLAASLLLIVLVLTACGQKGDLYLPESSAVGTPAVAVA